MSSSASPLQGLRKTTTAVLVIDPHPPQGLWKSMAGVLCRGPQLPETPFGSQYNEEVMVSLNCGLDGMWNNPQSKSLSMSVKGYLDYVD